MSRGYYKGGMRLVREGVPIRCAAWVAELTALSLDSLYRPTNTSYHPQGSLTVHDYTGGKPKTWREIECQARHPQTKYKTAAESLALLEQPP